MLLERCSANHAEVAWILLALCLCVVMQMLGTTMTLWDFELQLDPPHAPLLEGLSLPTVLPDTTPSLIAAAVTLSSETLPHLLSAHSLLRPPNTAG